MIISDPSISSSSINPDNSSLIVSKRVLKSEIFLFDEDEDYEMDSDDEVNYHTTWSD